MGVRSRGFYSRLSDELVDYIQDFTKYDLDNGEGDTRRARAVRAGAGDKVTPLPLSNYASVYVSHLWELRGFCGDPSAPIQPSLMRDWSDDMGISLSRAEKRIIYSMDKAFRAQYPKTVAYYDQVRARQK